MLKSRYGFHYSEHADPLMLIRTIGWESTVNEHYRWDGRTRGDKFVLFQYTLAGEGHLVYRGKHYALPPNHGFFAKIPDDHQYYYPTNSNKPWEFIFMTAEGAHIFPYWNEMLEKVGPVVVFKPNAQPINMLWDMMQNAHNRTMQDKYEISVRLYEWIMACLRSIDGKPESGQDLPDSISAALRFMESHYHRFITLDEIASAAGTSKYHFCRLFFKTIGVTPIHHLTRIRIAEASGMLRQTNLSVAEIATSVGFDNSSYFGKVFRKMMSMSPQQFREGTDDVSANPIFID